MYIATWIISDCVYSVTNKGATIIYFSIPILGDIIIYTYMYIIYIYIYKYPSMFKLCIYKATMLFHTFTLTWSCNCNNKSLSLSTCCCSEFSDDWKCQVTPSSSTTLTIDSTKLAANTPSLLILAILFLKLSLLTAVHMTWLL